MPSDPQRFDVARLFEASPNASAVLDAQLRIVGVNREYKRLTGLAWEDLRERPLAAVFEASGEYHLMCASLDRVLEHARRDDVPFVAYGAPSPAGVQRYLSATNVPVLDDDGSVRWVLHQVADVTEHRRETHDATHDAIASLGANLLGRASSAQAELFELRRMFDQAPGFMAFVRGPQHRFELANAAYLHLIGSTRAIIGKTVAEALPEVASQGYLELLDRVFSTGEPFVGKGMEIALASAPGEPAVTYVVDFVYQPITVGGVVTGIFCQGIDITAARTAERQRAALAEEYQRLLDIAPQQVWTADPDGSLDRINDLAVEYFGIPRAQVLGDGWQGVVHPDDLPTAGARWLHSLATGETYETAFRLRRADGTYRWHLARATSTRNPDGTFRWIGTNTDIDQNKRDHDDLVSRAAYEEKLIGIVSHDLRNPLNTIALGVQAIDAATLPPGTQKTLKYIETATKRAGQLITDLLDFAQARNGTFPVRPSVTSLPRLVRNAVEEVKRTAGPREVTVTHEGPEIGAWDEGRVVQVITNLVGNAFQHAPDGAAIRVSSRIDGDRTSIGVFNEGPVIGAEDMPRLFDPFARGKNARTKSGRSVGLGLFIARQIALAHGGDLGVSSVVGEGTTFIVTLPTRSLAHETR